MPRRHAEHFQDVAIVGGDIMRFDVGADGEAFDEFRDFGVQVDRWVRREQSSFIFRNRRGRSRKRELGGQQRRRQKKLQHLPLDSDEKMEKKVVIEGR